MLPSGNKISMTQTKTPKNFFAVAQVKKEELNSKFKQKVGKVGRTKSKEK